MELSTVLVHLKVSFLLGEIPQEIGIPKKLSYDSQVKRPESDQKKLEGGWKLGQRVKARRAAGIA